ncbi:hypothetical protein LCE31_28975, partial [Streptomyces sp. 8L]|nr:hypothetical protein [Streptomyces sp. 8L]
MRVASAGASAPVADAGFSSSLTTWQNPSFAGTLSHAVLDGAPGGLVKGALAVQRAASAGPELAMPSLTLPVAAAGPATETAPAESGSTAAPSTPWTHSGTPGPGNALPVS